MRQPQFTNRFKKDIKRLKKRGKQPQSLERIIDTICKNGEAPSACRPHNLSGTWAGYRECHIESDWLIIYAVQKETVTFYRTGTHSDLFD